MIRTVTGVRATRAREWEKLYLEEHFVCQSYVFTQRIRRGLERATQRQGARWTHRRL